MDKERYGFYVVAIVAIVAIVVVSIMTANFGDLGGKLTGSSDNAGSAIGISSQDAPKCGDGVINQQSEECEIYYGIPIFANGISTCHGSNPSYTAGNLMCDAECKISYADCR